MLDKEWLKLITEAKHIGLTTEEIRAFLWEERNKWESEETERTG